MPAADPTPTPAAAPLAELLPCPFCGGGVKLERPIDRSLSREDGPDDWWGVVCRNTENLGGTCAINQRPSRTKAAAVERWNRRAAPSPASTEGLRERLVRAVDPSLDEVTGPASEGSKLGRARAVADRCLAALRSPSSPDAACSECGGDCGGSLGACPLDAASAEAEALR